MTVDARQQQSPPVWSRVLQTGLATFLSLVVTGLGQAYNKQWIKAIFLFVVSSVFWMVFLGWVIHLWGVVDAGVVRWLQSREEESTVVDGLPQTGVKFVLYILLVVATGAVVKVLWPGYFEISTAILTPVIEHLP